jgi:hypothetical protein
LETLRQLAALDHGSAEISRARAYIAGAEVPAAAYPNLAVALERGWSAIARDAAAFKFRYSQAYREHYQKFHNALPEFQATLTTAKKKTAALGLLNTIAKLGMPDGIGLEEDLASLAVGPARCSQSGSELGLSIEPNCPECQIGLAQTVPAAELARLAPQVNMALGGKTRGAEQAFGRKGPGRPGR